MYVMDENNLALSALVTLGMQCLFFFISAILKVSKVTDVAGGISFALIALLTMFLAEVRDICPFYVNNVTRIKPSELNPA